MWRVKVERAGKNIDEKSKIYSLVGRDFSLGMDEQTIGFVEPCAYYSSQSTLEIFQVHEAEKYFGSAS
jgi:hypothetical protein